MLHVASFAVGAAFFTPRGSIVKAFRPVYEVIGILFELNVDRI